MKPTLYAGDDTGAFHVPCECCYAASAADRVLPRRCPERYCEGGIYVTNNPTPGDGLIHAVCGGRGWLYPEIGIPAINLRQVWRAMGIIEDNEGA